ncbi:MAG TPA: hypothetical protein DDW76_24470 [Cyanobacteria bacterium UBA11369]|nr:hypothetical protein [Cyanobacteria bacterium UBA11371]HBE31069.1 hypothetical protein [Cyanobacteria bacterium UBA11368]HBE51841.1 hypothetical protein [Cyanobacteria bacterium UBA11369]
METLHVKGMMANHKLAQAIRLTTRCANADASRGELVRKLEYKARRYGRNLVNYLHRPYGTV